MPLTISVGICAYNEQENIGPLLKNLLAEQNLSQNSEVIVVCSGCTDKTPMIVEDFVLRESRVKLIVEKERRGKASALNLFLDSAIGQILVIISADSRPGRGAVERLAKSIRSQVGGACAETLPVNKNRSVMEFCYWFLWRMHNRTLQKESQEKTLHHFGGDMWALKKGIISYIPNEVINDDAYLGIMLWKKGWQLVFVPEASLMIKGPATPIEYIQQRERIVVGHKQVKQITDIEPTTIGALALKRPLFSIRLLVKEMGTQKIRDYPKIPIGLFLELIAQTSATINFKKKDKYVRWKQIRGTKRF